MFTFLIQSSICLTVFYIFYHLVLAELRFFHWNRIYLVGALTASVLIPWLAPYLTIPESQFAGLQWTNILDEVVVTANGATADRTTSSVNWYSVVYWIYLTGVCIVFSRFSYGLGKIALYYYKGKVIPRGKYHIVETGLRHLPFSFYRFIFVGTLCEEGDALTVIEHEKVHIRQKHTLDVLFMECYTIFFWFHPLLPLYKRELRQVHECLADDAVCQTTDTLQYIEVLLRKPEAFHEAGLGHTFYQSQLKQRLHMMTNINHHGKTRWVYLASLPVLTGLVLFFSTPLAGRFSLPEPVSFISNDTLPKAPKAPKAPASPSNTRKQKPTSEVAPPPPPVPPTPPAPPAPSKSPFVQQAPPIEEMPRYFQAECEGLTTKKEKEDCAGNNLIRYVAENLVYPEAARKDSIEGMVIVQFMVKEDGSMWDVSIVRDIGYGCGEAVINVLQPLTGRKNVWTPGKDKGKKVSVMQTLPVRFKLN